MRFLTTMLLFTDVTLIQAGAAGNTLVRKHDAVSLAGQSLPSLLGISVDQIVGSRYDDSDES